jgi:hypothetical protein
MYRKTTNLDSLGVHFVVLIRPRPVEPSVSLLVDEEIGEIDFLELELDGLDEFG